MAKHLLLRLGAATTTLTVGRTAFVKVRMAITPCERLHPKLIAGSCPWCDSFIIDGEPLVLSKYFPELSEYFPERLKDDAAAHVSETSNDVEGNDYLLNLIESVGTDAERAIPLLLAALEDPKSEIREAAANTLAKIGADAKAALPTLYCLLDDDDVLVRDAADAAIESIGL